MKNRSPEVGAFLLDLIAVCDKHKLALSYVDTHGFEVKPISSRLLDWLLDASDCTEEAP